MVIGLGSAEGAKDGSLPKIHLQTLEESHADHLKAMSPSKRQLPANDTSPRLGSDGLESIDHTIRDIVD